MNKLYSLKKLEEIAQGDNAFVQDMVSAFIDTVSVEVTNIQELMGKGEWKDIGGIAHKLVTNYAYMDAVALFALAVDIEKKAKNGCDLTEITATTGQLCADSLILINELKKCFININ